MSFSPPNAADPSHASPNLSSSRSAVSVSGSNVSTSTIGMMSATGGVGGRHPNLPRPSQHQQQPALLSDGTSPRAHSIGLLIVGIGGANGTTCLAGILANKNRLSWKGPRGEDMSANYYGCITQLEEKGVHGGVGFRGKVKGLADASTAAVGGWDIRSAKLGDALLEAQILDYDLVKKVREEMNRTKVFRGYYDPRFIGPSQHGTASHVIPEKEVPSASEALKLIRADIRYFKWRNGVVGHTTVIWSASVEPNSELCVPGGGHDTARQLLDSFEMSEAERGYPISPSVVYATAAILEGCSFVNGGSQNTLCGGLAELAQKQPGVYCLGTDYKAGQTKFKTAAIEYIRTMGLTPKVIASSNHLGNNDMRNLATADKARLAKLRVKHDIFAPWEEDIDHKVSIMFTPMINDEKRDFVEYTSLGFLGQTHTMVTYTRASDSVLCVPLMIDAAIWCDFFGMRNWPYENVAKALAYLFKVPEGSAKGVDPGFFRQMEELRNQVILASQEPGNHTPKKTDRIPSQDQNTEWAIPNGLGIVCAGLACVDMQLNQATGGHGGESIETFQGETSIGGGSVSMACKALSRLCHGPPSDKNGTEATSAVVSTVIPLCKIGNDDTGNKLISLLERTGDAFQNVNTKYIKTAQKNDPNSRTALAVLPIYQDGRRGCFFDAASNVTFQAGEIIGMIQNLMPDRQDLGALLFGYPHLLPKIQGESLASVFLKARSCMSNGGIIALDLNGVPEGVYRSKGTLRTVAGLNADPVLGAALPHVDILHMNEDELSSLTGCVIQGTDDSQTEDEFTISAATSLFLKCGVAVVAVTRGSRGCFVTCNNADRFMRTKMLPSSWKDCSIKMSAAQLPHGAVINANGAGDAFTSGLLVATMLRHTGKTAPAQTSSDTVEGNNDTLDELTSLPPLPRKTVTPYTVYMQERYVSLKAQCQDDKKEIFSKCHDLWENESEEVKSMYERKCAELEEQTTYETKADLDMTGFEVTNRNYRAEIPDTGTIFLADRSLTLDSAARFAGLVAAHHIDVRSRDMGRLDISSLLESSFAFSDVLEEI